MRGHQDDLFLLDRDIQRLLAVDPRVLDLVDQHPNSDPDHKPQTKTGRQTSLGWVMLCKLKRNNNIVLAGGRAGGVVS